MRLFYFMPTLYKCSFTAFLLFYLLHGNLVRVVERAGELLSTVGALRSSDYRGFLRKRRVRCRSKRGFSAGAKYCRGVEAGLAIGGIRRHLSTRRCAEGQPPFVEPWRRPWTPSPSNGHTQPSLT
jgi:hypothetical protein